MNTDFALLDFPLADYIRYAISFVAFISLTLHLDFDSITIFDEGCLSICKHFEVNIY